MALGMKTMLVLGLVTLGFTVAACGGESGSVGDPDRSSSSGGSRSGTSAPSADGDGNPEATPAVTDSPPAPVDVPAADDAGAPSSSSSSGGTGAGLCQPNADCGGITTCIDRCYGERCCYLTCSCQSNTTNRLSCSLSCD